MARKFFGTDGIRGKANEGSMTPEVAFRLGAAVVYTAKQRVKHPPRVVVGKDTRISGYLFENALAAGICTMGGRVLLTGPLPTPAVAHLTTSMRADAGIVISASHNPYQDNGLKVFGPDGFKLPDEEEEAIERLMQSDELDRKRPSGMHIGRAERIETAWGRYVQFIKGTFPSDLTLDGLRVVVDAAHGAAYVTAPHVFSELGATVHAIGVKPNGRNINHERGAIHPDYCAKEVKRTRANIGIALDGDADRLIVIDELGQRVNGDAIMALCATRMLKRGELKKRTLVTTVMSSIGLDHALRRENGKLVRVDVGDRYVVEAMRKKGYNFGGEQSGHLVFLDHSTTGDGTLGALQLLAIMLREGKPISELVHGVIDAIPQVLVNVSLPARRPLSELIKTRSTIEGVERKLGEDGRVLVRWSGTEPKLRVMVEGPDEDTIRSMAQSIADTAQQELR
ncbi:MAG TPA: phosphoglucosamine mutase [Polyangiales bacterium]|jgi:phosphoglucosamine mutase|nr:phosphoglucosamine mutase [Polyangiales bacterium]